jgi:PST family polysaccharide transporter
LTLPPSSNRTPSGADGPEPPVPPGPLGYLAGALSAFLPRAGEGALIRRNTAWLLSDRAFRLGLGLVVNVWLVRYLGADSFGLMSFAQSLVVIFAVLSQLGLETIVVRELVRRPEAEGTIVGTSIALRFVGSLTTLACAGVAAALIRPHDPASFWLTVIFSGMAFAQTLDVLEYWFQSRSLIPPLAGARMAAGLIGSAAKVAAIVMQAPLEGIALVIVGEYAVSSLALLAAFVRRPEAPRAWKATGAMARELLRESWPLVLNSVAIVISVRVDQMLITSMRGTSENGIYAAAQRLMEVVYYLPVATLAAANPILLRWHGQDMAGYESRLQKVLSALALAGIVIALGISLTSSWIVVTLFGADFREAGPVLMILAWNAPVLFVAVAQTNWFIAHGRQRGLMTRSLVSAALSVTLNLLLIPRLGARGAAISMLVSQLVAQILVNALTRDTRHLFVMQCRAFFPFLPR